MREDIKKKRVEAMPQQVVSQYDPGSGTDMNQVPSANGESTEKAGTGQHQGPRAMNNLLEQMNSKTDFELERLSGCRDSCHILNSILFSTHFSCAIVRTMAFVSCFCRKTYAKFSLTEVSKQRAVTMSTSKILKSTPF